MVLSKHYQVNEVEISYKQHSSLQTNLKITCSRDAYKAFLQTWNMNTIDFKEEFKVMLMNRAGRVIGIYQASIGGITEVTVDQRVVFVTALKANATSIILAHNHPSNNLAPSRSDVALTKAFKVAGEILKIAVHDHLIIGREHYTSLSDDGLL